MNYYFAVNLYGEPEDVMSPAPVTTQFVLCETASYRDAVKQIVTAAGSSFGGMRQIKSPKMIREISWDRLT